MWYEDLAECDFFGEEYSNIIAPVGWLERGRDFPTGTVPKDAFLKLFELKKNPWQIVVSAGFHECDLCQFQLEFENNVGNSNLCIPHNGKIYFCPELITHYINAHHYLPPREFVEAIYLCPPMRSIEYLKKIVENGGRNLVNLSLELK
jgi:hypothetical protein